jgi:hypothetical protein
LYTTCDRQYQPADLGRLLEAIDKVDLVTGYRAGRVPGWYGVLRGLTYLFALVIFGLQLETADCWLGRRGLGRRLLSWWVLRVRVHDSECTFRLCRREIFEKIPIQSESDFAQIEILAKATFLGMYLHEVPVTFTPQPVADTDKADAKGRSDIWGLLRSPEFGSATKTDACPPH